MDSFISEEEDIKVQMQHEEQSNLSEPQQSEHSQQNIGKKWTQQENIKFVLFMNFYQTIFNRKRERQSFRIFKKLSIFLGSRTPRQCRCHFQKLINRFKTPIKVRKFFKTTIGEKEYEKEFQAISNILQPLSLDYKIKNMVKSGQKKDSSIQVDLDEEEVEQNYWRGGLEQYQISSYLYLQQMMEYPPVYIYPLQSYFPVKEE